MSEQPHWTDKSFKACAFRNQQRYLLQSFPKSSQASKTLPEVIDTPEDMQRLVADAERHPGEYFKCGVCGTGPWHITWGGMCPNCSGVL